MEGTAPLPSDNTYIYPQKSYDQNSDTLIWVLPHHYLAYLFKYCFPNL